MRGFSFERSALAPTYSRMHDYHPGTTTLRVGYGAGRLSPLPCLARRKLCFPAGLPVVEISFQCFVLAPSYSRLSTTIASGGLNCRVRNENGCDPSDKALAQNTEEIISADFTTGHRRNAWPGRKLRFPTGQNGCDPTAEAPAQNAQSCCTAYADTTNTAFCSSNLKRVTQKS